MNDELAAPQPAVPAASTHTGMLLPPAHDAASPMNLLAQTSVSLLAVLAIIMICIWTLKKLGWQRGRSDRDLPVMASRSLGPRERVVVVQVQQQWLVLGVTPQQISLLHQCPAPAAADANAGAESGAPADVAAAPFKQALARRLTHSHPEHPS